MELLERFAAGDLDAFETLFRQHQKAVYSWIVRIVRDSGVAEDLTVETFWRIYRSRSRFDLAGSFPAWARRIATNAALDHLRSSRRETSLPDDIPCPAQPDPAIQSESRRKSSARSRSFPQNTAWSPRSRLSKTSLMKQSPMPPEYRLPSSRCVYSGRFVCCAKN